MKIDKRTRSTFLRGAFLALVLSMVLASSASASPAWKVNGLSLEGSETIAGDAIFGKFVIPGLTITCKKMHYTMTISNSAGTGKGELTSLTFQTCLTNTKACTIKSIEAENLPWPSNLATVSAKNYVVVKNVRITIVFAGLECVLDEVVGVMTGSAGGLYDNVFETFTFSAANFSATGTSLKMLGSPVEWNALFTTEALGAHAGEALTIS